MTLDTIAAVFLGTVKSHVTARKGGVSARIGRIHRGNADTDGQRNSSITFHQRRFRNPLLHSPGKGRCVGDIRTAQHNGKLVLEDRRGTPVHRFTTWVACECQQTANG